MKPFLKWAGGKTQLLEIIKENIPKEYNNYYEPFIGGGALLLDIKPQKAIINDINKQLINIYQQLKTSPEAIISAVKAIETDECNKEYYYQVRNRYNEKIGAGELDVEAAALMIWLNKHCFNGLYRVNKKGLFNVPYNNSKTKKSIDEENLLDIGSFLKNVEIRNIDFEEACKDVKAKDFVYFDSPYIPESLTANFTSYTEEGFNYKDHKRLAELFAELDRKGAYVMLSNNDVDLIYELYDKERFNIISFDVKRMINRNAADRTGREVLITNYKNE